MNHESRPTERGFQYTYSAKEQAEIRRMRDKYAPAEPSLAADQLARLKQLDASVTRRGTAFALGVGIFSCLVMGLGMSLVMTDLGGWLGLSLETARLMGIVIGVVGMIGVIAAYPLYHAVTERERRRVAPEILRLTEELLDQA